MLLFIHIIPNSLGSSISFNSSSCPASGPPSQNTQRKIKWEKTEMAARCLPMHWLRSRRIAKNDKSFLQSIRLLQVKNEKELLLVRQVCIEQKIGNNQSKFFSIQILRSLPTRDVHRLWVRGIREFKTGNEDKLIKERN